MASPGDERLVRRRSLRLASKSNAPPATTDDPTPTPTPVVAASEEPALPDQDQESESDQVKEDEEEEEEIVGGAELEEEKAVQRSASVRGGKGKRKSGDMGEAAAPATTLTLRSGKKVSKRSLVDRSKGKSVQGESDIAEFNSEKGKGKSVEGDSDIADFDSEKGKGKDKLVSENVPLKNVGDETSAESSKRRLTREEKGKAVVVEQDLLFKALLKEHDRRVEDDDDDMSVDLDMDLDVDGDIPVAVTENVGLEEGRREEVVNDAGSTYRGRFRSIAKRNAVRFAHYNAETGEGNIDGPFEAVRAPPVVRRTEAEPEDWPGPFSTAMKIIRDRANKENVQQKSSAGLSSTKDEPLWVPKQSLEPKQPKPSPPSLEDLSLYVLVKNVDAISSLSNVPDVIRHKLCQVLSDSRKMNGYLFKLLLSGSPVEVRIKDSSWLTEEDFMEHFAGCDTSNLTVLQLDQCGRCMPDYVVHSTLAQSSNRLPALAALSVQAACRLSDTGLAAIVSAAPRLQSINLSQCSLLTTIGIESLTISLGSVLKELYIDDCQSINVMECLPCLKNIKCLEVLSVAGIESVCDDFIRELMVVHGPCLKELILTDCMNLTDSSLKAIAENSTSLCSLNLVNISNLTDIGIGYLANGILKFKILKFCRNAFSDEALAAFVETGGDCLEELWLNNITLVGRFTAVSLAKHSRKLVTLDLSWCRNLTDDALGLIVDSCDSLRILKIFGCTQLTDVFFNGHSNQNVQVIGRKMTPILKHIKGPNPLQGPLRYSSVLAV